jgi:hypothetical protein
MIEVHQLNGYNHRVIPNKNARSTNVDHFKHRADLRDTATRYHAHSRSD